MTMPIARAAACLLLFGLPILTAEEGAQAPEEKSAAADKAAPPAKDAAKGEAKAAGEKPDAGEVPMTQEQQDQLLARRIDCGMSDTFARFANMFLVTSRLKVGPGIGLMSASKKVRDAELQSPFPSTYAPTMREFLDAIALQTSSEWKYDPSGKFVKDTSGRRRPAGDLVMFEFTEAARAKPYTIELAEGWKAVDKGNWVMHVPPDFPVGMDVYEMGSYSADDPAEAKELPSKIRAAVSLEWAQRVSEKAKAEDLKPAKVGSFEALHFDAMIPSQLGKNVRWRQWVFMDGNKCYFVVSTIFPELEAKIYPDVEKMLKTFKAVKK